LFAKKAAGKGKPKSREILFETCRCIGKQKTGKIREQCRTKKSITSIVQFRQMFFTKNTRQKKNENNTIPVTPNKLYE